MISGNDGRERERPAAFSDERFAAALARAEKERRWLLVEVTDASKPIAWATLYTTWRDPDLVAWLDANAIAIQVDARLDSEAARALGVDGASAPMVILFRDGKERCRIEGHKTAAELLRTLERADNVEANLALARGMLKHPETDMRNRDGLAEALLETGLLGEALGHFDWLWQHMAEVDEEAAGVRLSFMAYRVAELCRRLPAARVRFTEHRDRAAAAVSTHDEAGLRACVDFVVLNEIIDDEARILAWFDELDAGQRRALPERIVALHLLPLLHERERWKDAGGLIRDPLRELDEIIESARMLGDARPADAPAYVRRLIVEGQPEEAKLVRRHGRGTHGDVMVLHRSLTAAGREQDAAAVREAALRFEDSPAMRAALR